MSLTFTFSQNTSCKYVFKANTSSPATFIAYFSPKHTHITNWHHKNIQNSINRDNIYCIEENENVYIIDIIINTVYEAVQEIMYTLAKPLSPNKCITIGMYFSATNKAITDKTLKVGKELTQVMTDCVWKTYKE